jgi:hypothetical protein
VINGTSYTPSSVDLLITAPSITIPVSTDPTLTFVEPCTVTGHISGASGLMHAGAGFSGNCTATFTMQEVIGTDGLYHGLYNSKSINYSFTAAPEPATIVLLVSGLVGFGSVALRRRYKSAK